jgi:hypothetical protein
MGGGDRDPETANVFKSTMLAGWHRLSRRITL